MGQSCVVCALPIDALARGVTQARAGSPGTASANTVRSQTAPGRSHFPLAPLQAGPFRASQHLECPPSFVHTW